MIESGVGRLRAAPQTRDLPTRSGTRRAAGWCKGLPVLQSLASRMLNGEEEGIVTGREARAVERGSDLAEEEARGLALAA
jgi:hypothetical protein